MRLVNITYSFDKSENPEGDWNLILETKQDVIDYFALTSERFSRDVIDFWMKAKSIGPEESINQLSHQVGPKNIAHSMAYMYISSLKEGDELTISEYCGKMDSILVGKFESMLNIIDNDNNVGVRVNHCGGYSAMDNFFKIIEETPFTTTKLIAYLNHDDEFLNPKLIKIESKTLLIENDKFISTELLDFIKAHGVNNSDTFILTDFENETFGYKENQYYELFNTAINNRLEEIILETSLIKSKQFKNIKTIIESVMINNPDKNLTVHILRNGFDHEIETKVKNITIHNW